MRSPFAPVALALAALIAALLRWWQQGSGNLYTATSKRFYVEDPDVGWVESSASAVWLGLEVIAIVGAITAGLAIGGLVIRRRERTRGRPARVLRAAAWVAAVLPLAVPVVAFASGGRPAGAVDLLPKAEAPAQASLGIAGALDAPAGRYEVVAHEGTAITAQLKAGGEAFDARFTRTITGTWEADPRDLRAPMRADVRVATEAVDTGVSARSNSARDQYLQASAHPQIRFALERVTSAQPEGADRLRFTARGTLDFIGRTHSIEVTGTLRRPDAAALGRLKLAGSILLVQADFALRIADTALGADSADFDTDSIPIHVSLVLRHTGG